ncbi:hypothetical protein [Telluribacter humicola]|uniref:hypothetical protein n=1 Tax=Telluribacter humicola TaxID=1720261 RepID=UPI001A971059|nr:hypothetical protein [Telluribacter humicola]
MAATYQDLKPDWDDNALNMGGTQQIGWYGSLPDFLTIAKPASAPVDPLEEYVIATPHVMKTGKKMHQIYTEVNKGELDYEPLGSEDGGGFKVTGKLFIPGDTTKLNYFANKVRQSKYIFLIPDADGLLNQIGTEGFPATIKMAKKSSTNDGVKGYECEVSAYMPHKLIYDAVVPTTPAA